MSFQQFLAPARVSIKEGFVYKFEFFAWAIIMPITLIIFYFLWQAAFSYGGFSDIRGMSFKDLVAYYSMTIILAILTYSSVIEDLPTRIKKGKFAIDLLQPMNIIKKYLSEYFGYKTIVFFFQVLPIIVLAFFLIRPTSLSAINTTLFAVSLLFAGVISFLMWFCISLLAFWMKEVQGIRMAIFGINNILRGAVVPIIFFPQSVQVILNYTPFPYTMFVPIQILIGKLSLVSMFSSLAIQIFWIFAFLLLAKFILSKGIRLFTGAGI